uniref:Uncharacterized protein AlNc14C1G88 n=1 Tax=Albugo laibachii Nc14 TaxID=890382 RepID=F0VYT7_9STRA|nr:conserved hypothetical protein [Albugo laibachii Nc14]|eukprot:CCA13952.1 conserved hypothetical protein [Albugo laibachii Nc14]
MQLTSTMNGVIQFILSGAVVVAAVQFTAGPIADWNARRVGVQVTMAESEDIVEPLHLDFEDREIYLAKIPTALGASWKKIKESDLMLGSIKLNETGADGRRRGLLNVNPMTIDDEVPTEYRIEIGPTPLKLKVFSQDGSGRMAIEGTVSNSCTIIAQRNDQYSKMCKQRLLRSMVKTRIVQPLEDLPRVKKARIQFTIDKPDPDTEEAIESKISERLDKKVKMSKDELKDLVFHHFDERDFWPLKELNSHCRQPESFLKEVLKEICVYHRKGPNKSCYELKPQYKDGVSKCHYGRVNAMYRIHGMTPSFPLIYSAAKMNLFSVEKTSYM